MPKIVGIDLGTTNSVIAVMEGSEPTVIPMSDGGRLCPSVVGFNRTGERLVGNLAKRQAVSNPDRTISSIKRQMGKDHTVAIDGKGYTPQEISAMVLQKLKADAEAFLAAPVDQAVVTVPAYFSDAQRQATKDAGTIAGLDVVRIINEPTAAALSYGMDKEEFHTLLVWDLGGGTFDVSILELDAGVFDVRATSGDTLLGGDDWDQRIVDWLVARFREENEIDLRRDRLAMQRLKEAAEKAKIELSAVVTTTINLPFLSTTTAGPLHLDVNLSRAQLESLTSDLLERLVGPTKRALDDAGIGPGEVDRVLLVGGSTRMPAVQALVEKMFGKEPFKGVNPDEVVALGAAIQGAVLAGDVKDVVLLDVTPLSLGIETLGGVMTRLIERNTTVPTSKTEMFTTASDGQTAVDVKVYQGEREIASYNKHLANFQLTGLRPARRGETRIAVTFDIDVNGIVHVSARDTASGREQTVSITSATGLSKDEIDRMVREAQQHATEDRSRRELQDDRNRAEAVLAAAERSLSDANRSLDPNSAERVETAIAELRETLGSGDREAVRCATERLAYALHDFDSNGRETNLNSPAASFVRDVVDEMNRGYAREDEVLDGDFTPNTPVR